MICVRETHSAMQSSVHNPTALNCLSAIHVSHCLLHSITESHLSLSGPVFTFIYVITLSELSIHSSCHLKGALMQRRFVQHTPVMQVLPASPELCMQVYQRLPTIAAQNWTVTRLRSLIQRDVHKYTRSVATECCQLRWSWSSWRLTSAIVWVTSAILVLVLVRFQK